MSDGAHWTKGLRDTSCLLLVEEKSELLRSTGKACQELEIALTPLTMLSLDEGQVQRACGAPRPFYARPPAAVRGLK
jgi:hypothetical protein